MNVNLLWSPFHDVYKYYVMMYNLNLHNVIYQLYLNKSRGKNRNSKNVFLPMLL